MKRIGFLAWALVSLTMVAGGQGRPAMAQEEVRPAAEVDKQEKRRQEADEALKTLSSLLRARGELEQQIKELKKELRAAKEDATKKEVGDKILEANTKQQQIEQQLLALSTGVSDADLKVDDGAKFDLQAELESLAQPFVKMMKDATRNAREIEALTRTETNAAQLSAVAKRAVERLDLLIAREQQIDGKKKNPTYRHLTELRKQWIKRVKEAEDLGETARQQLSIVRHEQENASDGIGSYATSFFRSRGINLLLALSAFGAVLLTANLLGRLASWLFEKRRYQRTLTIRALALFYKIVSVLLAFFAMLIVFNVMNDWILLGISLVFALGIAWVGLKMLPNIIEQVVVLLNLGAVQENERVKLAGVPWLVKRLDFHTDLVNPALDGGEFTLPIRELIGLHSRPAGKGEPWFPTRKGDWIKLDADSIGKVISQTPELVQIREVGGSLITMETGAFLAAAHPNLSTGYRIRSEFGLDYRHQPIATTEIPRKMRRFVEEGLKASFGGDKVRSVAVDLLRAGDSAIVFEVEAQLSGDLAPHYEDVEREIAVLLIDACNANDWTIPFPQMVLHKAAV